MVLSHLYQLAELTPAEFRQLRVTTRRLDAVGRALMTRLQAKAVDLKTVRDLGSWHAVLDFVMLTGSLSQSMDARSQSGYADLAWSVGPGLIWSTSSPETPPYLLLSRWQRPILDKHHTIPTRPHRRL